jgi:hypothetical protein
MTKLEGSGMQVVLKLADGALRMLPEAEARSFVDGLTKEELAHAMLALSRAAKAAGGPPNLFYEAAAAHLLGVDVATHGSQRGDVAPCCAPIGPEYCARPLGHEGEHCMWSMPDDETREH